MLGNGRGLGITEALHGYAEWPVLVLFGLLTQLGDGWFLFLLGGSLYVAGDEFPRWRVDRRRGLFVLALALTYVALIGAIKAFFHLPRPIGAGVPPELLWLPASLLGIFDNLTTADGPGFPSGHALGSTMVWGGLALVVERVPVRKRLGIAGGVVLAVSLSRLVLGVHYLVDVVVGIGLGVLVLGALYTLAENGTEPGKVLFVAVVVGILGLLVGVTFESVAALGGAVGGWLVWRGIADSTPAHPADRRDVIGAFAVLGATGALFAVINVLEPPLPFAFVGAMVSAGGVVLAPLLGERIGRP